METMLKSLSVLREAQLYVAISRCRTLKGIHLVDGDITVEDIKICQRAYDFQYGDLIKEMELPAFRLEFPG